MADTSRVDLHSLNSKFPDEERPLFTADDELQREVAKRVNTRRKELHVSQEAIADAWSMTQARVSQILSNPESIGQLEKEKVWELERILKADEDWFKFGGEVYRKGFLSPDDLLVLYCTLPEEDMTLVSDLIRRLHKGDGMLDHLRHVRRKERVKAHLKTNRAEREKWDSLTKELFGKWSWPKFQTGFSEKIERILLTSSSPYEILLQCASERLLDPLLTETEQPTEQDESSGSTSEEKED